jgi:hypothetical protein
VTYVDGKPCADGVPDFVASGGIKLRVDGNTIRDRGLRGKPAPDTFLRAADLLGVRPDQAARGARLSVRRQRQLPEEPATTDDPRR